MTHHLRRAPLGAALLLATVAANGVHGQDIPEMSAEAAAAFADGMAKYTEANYASAAEAFARAHDLDPSFAVAAFFEGLNWGNAGDAERAREAYARAAVGRDRMSPYYQHRLDAQVAGIEGDRRTYLEENRKAARFAPGSKAVYNVAQGATGLRRPREALDALASLDPDRPPMKGWPSYWTVLHSAHHQVGSYEAELASAREARRRFPTLPALVYDEAEALAALGQEEELDAVVEAFEALDAPFDIFLISIAAEAEAHGHPAVARRLLDRAMEVYADMPEELASQNGPRNWKGIAHYSRGELAEADAVFRGLVADNPDNNGWRAWVGLIAAERGNTEAAEAEIRRLLEAPGNRATLSLYAASIAAAMGDGDRFGELISRALDEGLLFSVWDHRHPVYRKIRGHPAYQAFITPAA